MFTNRWIGFSLAAWMLGVGVLGLVLKSGAMAFGGFLLGGWTFLLALVNTVPALERLSQRVKARTMKEATVVSLAVVLTTIIVMGLYVGWTRALLLAVLPLALLIWMAFRRDSRTISD